MTLERVKNERLKDKELSSLLFSIRAGNFKNDVDKYEKTKQELAEYDKVILKQHQQIIMEAITSTAAITKLIGTLRQRKLIQYFKDKEYKHARITPSWPRRNGTFESLMKNINKTLCISSMKKQNRKHGMEKNVSNK